jgi:hypothetical protein
MMHAIQKRAGRYLGKDAKMLEFGTGAIVGERHTINKDVDATPWLVKLCEDVTGIPVSRYQRMFFLWASDHRLTFQ